MKASGAIISGVRYREEPQALQAENSPRGNQLANEKPTSGRLTSSSFQNALYLSIFSGLFPNGAPGMAMLLLRGTMRSRSDGGFSYGRLFISWVGLDVAASLPRH